MTDVVRTPRRERGAGRVRRPRRPRCGGRGRHDEAGMVTAEFAVLMPVIVVVLAAVLAAITCVVDHVRCVDAARAGVRAASRGDDPAVVRAIGAGLAPAGARIEVASAGDGAVVVRVSAPDRPVLGVLTDALRPRAEATMPLEPASAVTGG